MSESTWSPSPSADTLGTIQRQVAAYVLMPDDDEVLETALAGIRRAIDRLNTRNWTWMLSYDDITFVAGQTDYNLDTEFKSPRNFEYDDSGGSSQGRFLYKPWATFLKEDPRVSANAEPECYSVSNANSFGTLSLNCPPTAAWVGRYPTGRIWYYRRVQYPASSGGSGTALDCPSECVGFVSAFAEGYVADRYAPEKAPVAYQRAERFLHELIVDDCHGQQTDWE